MTFKDYILLEVQATEKNIEHFVGTYRVQMDDEEVADFFASFDAEVKRGTLKKINPKADAKDPHDIFSYHSWDDLYSAVERAKVTKTGKEVRRIEKEGSTKVFQNDKVLIVHPKTHEASCHYGAGSKWCTAQRDGSNFESYVDDQGVVLLYFLPRTGFKPPAFDVKQTKDDDATVDHLLLHYPEAFNWNPTSFSRSVGGYISAAYLNGRQSESLDIIAGWSRENASAIAQARADMKRVIQAWNKAGSKIVFDVLGVDALPGGGEAAEMYPDPEESQTIEDYLGSVATKEGLVGFITVGWDGDVPGRSATEPVKDYWTYIKAVMEQLKQGSEPLSLNRDPIFTSGIDTRWNKAAIAVTTVSEDAGGYLDDDERIDELEQVHGRSMRFGSFPAQGYLADDSEIEPKAILDAFGVTHRDALKMSEYIKQFAVDKMWEDGDTNKIFGFLDSQYQQNQTPENLKRADEFFSSTEKAFTPAAWNYAWQIRSKAKIPGYDSRERRTWKELEDTFISAIDDAVKEEKKVKGLMRKKQDFDGLQEIRADLEKKHGSSVGAPEPTEWINDQYKNWIKDSEMPMSHFLQMASGLLGYLFHIRQYNWPALEKRITDPKYYHIGLTNLGPSWIQHGRNGERWPEFEQCLLELWEYVAEHPYKSTAHDKPKMKEAHPASGAAQIPHWEHDQKKLHIGDHLQFHGNIDTIVALVKQTKEALGPRKAGGARATEETAWEKAKDAWWNNPDIVKSFWGGSNAIVMRKKPSEKKKGKPATKYYVTDRAVRRGFYHDVVKGTWMLGIPNIFHISQTQNTRNPKFAHTRADFMQYVGQPTHGPHPDETTGSQIKRHDVKRRRPAGGVWANQPDGGPGYDPEDFTTDQS